MSQLPKYSVVIPAYNAAHTIEKTLDSVLAQTVPPSEILVVDDGSTDTTCDVVSRYGDQVRLLMQDNAGPAAARNHGIRRASYDWIALVDADDTWLPEKSEIQLPYCMPDVGVVHCYEIEEDIELESEVIDFKTLWKHNYIGTSTVVLNRKTLAEVGEFVEDRAMMCAEDYNLWLRIVASDYRIVTVKKALIHYTPAEGNLSGQYERVIKAELHNVDVIAGQLNLPAEMVQAKKADLYEEYAKALFWRRNLRLARSYYGKLLRQRPSLNSLKYWLATFLPNFVLGEPRTATT